MSTQVGTVVPLSNLAPQERAVVRSLDGGHQFVNRMVSLGFTPGVPVVMVQNFGRGPMIVLVRNCRIALGRGEGSKVMVRREGSSHGGVED